MQRNDKNEERKIYEKVCQSMCESGYNVFEYCPAPGGSNNPILVTLDGGDRKYAKNLHSEGNPLSVIFAYKVLNKLGFAPSASLIVDNSGGYIGVFDDLSHKINDTNYRFYTFAELESIYGQRNGSYGDLPNFASQKIESLEDKKTKMMIKCYELSCLYNLFKLYDTGRANTGITIKYQSDNDIKSIEPSICDFRVQRKLQENESFVFKIDGGLKCEGYDNFKPLLPRLSYFNLFSSIETQSPSKYISYFQNNSDIENSKILELTLKRLINGTQTDKTSQTKAGKPQLMDAINASYAEIHKILGTEAFMNKSDNEHIKNKQEFEEYYKGIQIRLQSAIQKTEHTTMQK